MEEMRVVEWQEDNDRPVVVDNLVGDNGSEEGIFCPDDFRDEFNQVLAAQEEDQAPPEEVRLEMDNPPFMGLTRLQKKRFKVLATLIPPYTPYDLGSIGRGFGAFVIATIVSMTGLKVAGRYAGMWATYFGWSGAFLIGLSAASNIFANIFVRSTRVIWAQNRLRIMRRRWDENRMPLPDDDFIKNITVAQAIFSFIAASPWVVLAYQNAPLEWLPWLAWVSIVCPLTFVVEGSLALCSVADFHDFDHQRKEAVYQWKRKMLKELRNLMSPEIRAQYTLEMLDRAAHGEVYRVDNVTRESRETMGRAMALLALPYSYVVGDGVYKLGLSSFGSTTGPCQYEWVLNGGFLNTLLNMGTTSVTFISASTRFFLLSVSNTRLSNRVLGSSDELLFNIGKYKVVKPLIKKKKTQKIFNGLKYMGIIACLIIGFFSVGTAGGLTLKNLYCDIAVFLSLSISLFIALGGAFSVNTESVYSTLWTLITELIRYLITRPDTYNTGARFGRDMDEFCLIASHNVASMDADTVEANHLNTYDPGFIGEASVAKDRGLTQAQILALEVNRKVGIYPSRSDNARTQHLQAATQGILKTGQIQFFPVWRATQNVNRQGQPVVEEVPSDQEEEQEQEGILLQPMPPRREFFADGAHDGINREVLEEDDEAGHDQRAVDNVDDGAAFTFNGSEDDDDENNNHGAFGDEDDDPRDRQVLFADELPPRNNRRAFKDDDRKDNDNNAFPYRKL